MSRRQEEQKKHRFVKRSKENRSRTWIIEAQTDNTGGEIKKDILQGFFIYAESEQQKSN